MKRVAKVAGFMALIYACVILLVIIIHAAAMGMWWAAEYIAGDFYGALVCSVSLWATLSTLVFATVCEVRR